MVDDSFIYGWIKRSLYGHINGLADYSIFLSLKKEIRIRKVKLKIDAALNISNAAKSLALNNIIG